MIYDVIDNVIETPMDRDIYRCFSNILFETGSSYLGASNNIPHYSIISNRNSKIHTPIDGYILAVSHLIRSVVENKYNVKTSDTLARCHVVEHVFSDSCYGLPHTDCNPDADSNFISALYYSSLKWDDSFGGNTFIGNELVKFMPNRLVCFNSKSSHYGQEVLKETAFRRFALNVVIEIDSDNPFDNANEL